MRRRGRKVVLYTLLTVLVLALGIAVGAAQLFGASMALGAFLVGMSSAIDEPARAAFFPRLLPRPLLRSAVPLLNDLGLRGDWKLIRGDNPFFNVTKAIHNGLQGADRELSTEERKEARNAWAAATAQLVGFLYQQRFKDPQHAATLTPLELPNLLAALEHLRGDASAEQVVGLATSLEGFLQNLGRPKALARVVRVREAVAAALAEWSRARFLAEDAAVDRLLDAGRFGEAASAAQRVLEQARAAGEQAYDGAAYDLAMAHFSLARALKMSGGAGAALVPLQEAKQRFERLDGFDDVRIDLRDLDAGSVKLTSFTLTREGR